MGGWRRRGERRRRRPVRFEVRRKWGRHGLLVGKALPNFYVRGMTLHYFRERMFQICMDPITNLSYLFCQDLLFLSLGKSFGTF